MVKFASSLGGYSGVKLVDTAVPPSDAKMVLIWPIEYPVYRGRSEHDAQHVVLHYLVGRGRLEDLDDRAQPLDAKCQK
ncbi:hypothetical protein TNCV_301021 [Trichonephila clavipes]|nr:hypothetical protein TNCV_301021 [Trichonephila clavipes]